MNGAINESVTHLQLVKGQNCRSEMVSSAIHVLVWDFMGKLRFTHLPFDGLRFSFSIRDLKINIFKHFRLVNCSDQARWVYPSHQLCQWNRTNQPISSSLTQSLSRQRNERIIIRDRNYELKNSVIICKSWVYWKHRRVFCDDFRFCFQSNDRKNSDELRTQAMTFKPNTSSAYTLRTSLQAVIKYWLPDSAPWKYRFNMIQYWLIH